MTPACPSSRSEAATNTSNPHAVAASCSHPQHSPFWDWGPDFPVMPHSPPLPCELQEHPDVFPSHEGLLQLQSGKARCRETEVSCAPYAWLLQLCPHLTKLQTCFSSSRICNAKVPRWAQRKGSINPTRRPSRSKGTTSA